MRLALIMFFTASIAVGQTIATKVLTPGIPISVALNPSVTTTLLFPSPLAGTFGLGLVSGQGATAGGTVQVDHPAGSDILVLHALTATAHVLATVLLDGTLYVLDLQSSLEPDIAVTLVRAGSSQDTVAPKAEPLTAEEIQASRPKYDPELLIGLLRRARDSAILQPLYRDLYHGYAKRDAQYTSDSGTIKTTVTTIHRFSKEDAVVVQGVVENETDKPVNFDGRAATVLVANEVHPIKLLDCLRPIPPHTKTLIDVVIQGDLDGGRANLSIDNEFRIELPGDTGVWALKNGGSSPSGGFKVISPVRESSIPLTQTGRPKREGQ
jgi:hypothetical protein